MLFRYVRDDPGKPSPVPPLFCSAELTRYFLRPKRRMIYRRPAFRLLSVTESVALPPDSGVRYMPKNPPPPTCSKCRKPMHFMLVKTGGRKFRCVDCDVPDPLRLPEVAKLLTGELRPPE
jgi:hypothetical protein